MDLETKDRNKMLITLERSLQRDLSLWEKRNAKAEVEEFQTASQHGQSRCMDVQEVIKTLAQREDMLSCLEEAEIKDASKIEIDQLISAKDLDRTRGDRQHARLISY